MNWTRRALALILLQCLAFPAAAELTRNEVNGFSVSHTIRTKAEPFVVYRTLTAHIDQWWSAAHSWSGDASNLYMDVEQGGCFCERLPGGGRVEHLRIIYYAPGSELRFDGALGPLQQMPVQGRMIWLIEPSDAGSTVTFTYHVFGHAQGGLTEIAPAVDGVVGEQLLNLGQRLAR